MSQKQPRLVTLTTIIRTSSVAVPKKAYKHARDRRGRAEGYRSGLELDIALGLTALGVSFSYEEIKLRYTPPTKERTYTPDFIITTRSGKQIIVESKGRFQTVDRQKHLHVRASNPEVEIRFIFNNPNTRISKQSKTTYAMWCQRNGFLYAKFHKDEPVPREWLEE